MNATTESHPHTIQGFFRESVAGNSMAGGLGAVATIILAILGLAGIFTNIIASAATIVISIVILTEGLALSAAVRRMSSNGTSSPGLGGGVTAGFFGGVAALVLGILSLFRPDPEAMLAVALLVAGAAVLLGGGGVSRLSWLLQFPGDTALSEASASMIPTASGSLFIGLGTVVLGILAVVGLVPMTLVLVGLLSLGAAALFSSSSANHAAAH